MLDPSWRPDESAADLWVEHAANSGFYLASIAYGLHIAIFSMTIYASVTAKRNVGQRVAMICSTALFLLASLNFVTDAVSAQYAWIDYRNFPGGPAMFFATNQGIASLNTLGNVAGVAVSWLADAILMYRCYTVWGNSRLVIVVPLLMWLISIVFGSLVCYEAAQPNAGLTALGTLNVGLVYWSIAMSLNILLTILILVQLLRARKYVADTLPDDHAHVYTSIAAMIVESAAPYAILAFIFVVLYGIQNTAVMIFLPPLVQVEAMAPELIFLRVSIGRGWTSKTQRQITESTGMSFAPNPNVGSGTLAADGEGDPAMFTHSKTGSSAHADSSAYTESKV